MEQMSDALDFYGMDATLTPDEQQVRDVVRRFVRDRILPRAGALWQAGEFPREVIAEMAELGLYGPSLPEKYGGGRAFRDGVRPYDARARIRRFRSPIVRIRPEWSCHVCHLPMGFRRTKTPVFAKNGGRGGHRLFRTDRT